MATPVMSLSAVCGAVLCFAGQQACFGANTRRSLLLRTGIFLEIKHHSCIPRMTPEHPPEQYAIKLCVFYLRALSAFDVFWCPVCWLNQTKAWFEFQKC